MLEMQHFLKNIKRLEIAVEFQLSQKRMEIYYETMKDKFNDVEFELTTNYLIENCNKFPFISDFMKNHQYAVRYF